MPSEQALPRVPGHRRQLGEGFSRNRLRSGCTNIPLAAGEAQEDETILDNGFSGHGLVWFVHPDPPRLTGSR